MGSKWMVDCKGSGAECDLTQADAEDFFETLDVGELIAKQGGLASTVRAAILGQGYSISDSGGGGGCWHLGVPFDDLEAAKEYVGWVTDRFSKAIAAGLLRVELKTWSRGEW